MSNTSLLGAYAGQGGDGLMFRNVLINGDMRIWQRGASFTPTSLATIYTSDRWACYRPAFAAGLLATRQSASGLAGLPYALRVERSSGNSGTSTLTANQSIESINMLHLIGQTVTLSFYARCGSAFSASGSVLTSSFITGTGTDESLANTGYTGQVTTDQSNTISTSWQRFTQTYTVPSSVNEINIQFRYTPTGTSAGNDWFEVTGVQLEAGSVATPFERRPIGTELALCQRYYQRGNLTVGTSSTFGGQQWAYGTAPNSNWIGGNLPFKVEMRDTPTIRNSGVAGTINTILRGSTGTDVTVTLSSNKYGTFGNFVSAAFATSETIMFAWDASAEL